MTENDSYNMERAVNYQGKKFYIMDTYKTLFFVTLSQIR